MGRYHVCTHIYIPPYTVPPTTLIPRSRIPGLQGSQGYRVTGLPSIQVAKNHRVTGSRRRKVTETQGHRVTGSPESHYHMVTGSLGHWVIGLLGHWVIGSLGYLSHAFISMAQVSMVTQVLGSHDHWVTRYQGNQVSRLLNHPSIQVAK